MNEQERYKELNLFIDDMLDKLENLDQGVMFTPINHYDFYTILLIIKKIIKGEHETTNTQSL